MIDKGQGRQILRGADKVANLVVPVKARARVVLGALLN